jgi:DNA-binding response OmpR family regulator
MRILVVEDEEKMARALRKGLENEGYSVETVGTGDDDCLVRAAPHPWVR